MSTQFKEFMAPFQQVETLELEDRDYEYPGVSLPDLKAESLSEGYMVMPFNFNGLNRNYNHKNYNKCIVVEGFEPFRHTRQYVKRKHTEYMVDTPDEGPEIDRFRSLVFLTGLKDLLHPRGILDQWRNLKGAIHKRYFEEIGVDPSVLSVVLEADAEEYMDILNAPTVIDCFVVRYMSGMYEAKFIPQLSERDAINYIRTYQQQRPFRCCITIRNIKSITIEPNNTVTYHYCYPEFRIEGNFYRFLPLHTQ